MKIHELKYSNTNTYLIETEKEQYDHNKRTGT